MLEILRKFIGMCSLLPLSLPMHALAENLTLNANDGLSIRIGNTMNSATDHIRRNAVAANQSWSAAGPIYISEAQVMSRSSARKLVQNDQDMLTEPSESQQKRASRKFLTILDIEYATVDGKPLQLDLRIPADAGPHPIIVWIHGGGWMKGNKSLRPNHPAVRQLDRGYAVASINYRLSWEALFPAQIHDCKAAIRWLRGNAEKYNLEPGQIAVWGSSAGGHLAALLGTTGDNSELENLSMGNSDVSSRVQAVVDWYGPSDFLKMGAKHNTPLSPESLLLGCPIETCPERVAQANPINYVTENDPPFFIQHGTADRTVPINQSELLYEALVSAGVQASYLPMKGMSHRFSQFQKTDNLKPVEEFLDQTIGPKRVAGSRQTANNIDGTD